MCSYGISRQPRGAALVVVMLVMAVLLLAGTTFMTISSTETQIALNERAAGRGGDPKRHRPAQREPCLRRRNEHAAGRRDLHGHCHDDSRVYRGQRPAP